MTQEAKGNDVLTNERLIRLTRDLARDPAPTTLDEQQRYDIRHALVELQSLRACTCHPEDSPPIPCAQKYALSECRQARTDGGSGMVKGAGDGIAKIVSDATDATMARPEGRRGPFAIQNAADFVEVVSGAFDANCREVGGPFWGELPPSDRLRFIRMYHSAQAEALSTIQPVTDGWRTIDSAPKGHSNEYLIWREGWRKPRLGYWRGSADRIGWYGASGVKQEKEQQPTHWQPLPSSPGVSS